MTTQLLFVAFAFLATFLGLGAMGIPFSGAAAVGTGLAAVAATQRRLGLSWTSIGLGAPAGPGRFAGQVLAGLLAGWAVALAAMLLATRGFGWAGLDASRFAGIEGNAVALLGALAISWTTAAIGEEILFRGFLQSRLQVLFGARRHAGLLAAFAQAVLFGLGHAYQGPTGILVSGAIGLVFGLLMLRFRTVWPLVVAHGLIDTVSMVALYAGAGAG